MRDGSIEDRIVWHQRRQLGLVTLHQALAAGLTYEAIRHRLRNGEWLQVRRGVYASRSVKPTWQQSALAVVLAHDDALLASVAALRTYGVEDCEAIDELHVLTDITCHQRMAGVIAHRSKLIVPADRCVHEWIPIVSPALAVIGSSGRDVSDRTVLRWIDDLRRRGLLKHADLVSTVERMPPARNRSTKRMRRLLGLRDDVQTGDSPPELEVADWMVAAGYERPRLQIEVDVGLARPLRMDGGYDDTFVGYEYQSWKHHGDGQWLPFVEDAARANLLSLFGWDLYSFTSASTQHEVVLTLGSAIERRRRNPVRAVSGAEAQKLRERVARGEVFDVKKGA